MGDLELDPGPAARVGGGGAVRAPDRIRVLGGEAWKAMTSSVALRAFAASRLLVLAAGVTGALVGSRVSGWQSFDPASLSWHPGGFGGVLAGPFARWDAIHYLAIAGHGYATPADTVFFPLYPMLIHASSWLNGSAVVAAATLSAAAFACALVFLHRLTALELGRRAADATVVLLALAPLSFFFSAVYTESLFLALSVGAVYAARRDRWAVAGLLGALAALTRVPGVLLVIPLALIALQTRPGVVRRLVWLAAVPAGLIAYLGYLEVRGFGWLAPFHQQTASAHLHRFTGPVDTILSAVRAAATGTTALLHGAASIYDPSIGGALSPSAESIYLVLVLVLVLAAVVLVAGFRCLPRAYSAYALAVLLICLASPSAGQPLKSLDRYVLTIFPLWMTAGRCAAQLRLVRTVAVIGAVMLSLFTFSFATWAWIA
jgi:hypothetical protein